ALCGVASRNWLRNRLPCASPRLGSSVFCAHCGPPLRIWLDRPAPRGQQQRETDHTRDGRAFLPNTIGETNRRKEGRHPGWTLGSLFYAARSPATTPVNRSGWRWSFCTGIEGEG